MTTAALPQQAAMDSAVRYLIGKFSPKGNKVGWLMMASILVEAWDLYSIAFVLIFIRDQYHPDPFMLGLAAAGTQGGALIGALIGGWLSDKIGRRVMFLATMVMFIVLALAQAFVPSVGWLIVIRFMLGIPLGSDISTGYTYIMESMAKGEREVMGNRWQFMFAVGEVMTLAVIAVFLILNLDHETVWRVTLGLGALPAAGHPDHAARRAGNRGLAGAAGPLQGGQASRTEDVPRQSRHAAERGRRRAEAAAFGLPRRSAQGSDPLARHALWLDRLFRPGQRILDLRLLPAGAVRDGRGLLDPRQQPGHHGALLLRRGLRLGRAAVDPEDRTSRHRHRRVSIVLVSLLIAAAALYIDHKCVLPFVAAGMLWGHYWDASNCMTVPTMVAKPEYRGTASGFAYMFVKLPSFLAIFLFPSLFAAIGQANATLFVAIFPLIGFLAAIFVLPEVYGYEHD